MAFLRSIVRSNNLVLYKFNNKNYSDFVLNKNFKFLINKNCNAITAIAGDKGIICRFFSSTQVPQSKAQVKYDDQPKSRQGSPAPTSSSYSTAATTESSGAARNWDPLDVGFNDPIAAFKSKTTWELCRAYLVYMLCSSEFLVENNMKVNLIYFKFFFSFLG